jgi:hypothetical protein
MARLDLGRLAHRLLESVEAKVISWILGMQDCELSITLQQLKFKTVELTQIRPTPFKDGIPRNSRWYWFKLRHPKISTQLAKGLEISKARGLTKNACISFY